MYLMYHTEVYEPAGVSQELITVRLSAGKWFYH